MKRIDTSVRIGLIRTAAFCVVVMGLMLAVSVTSAAAQESDEELRFANWNVRCSPAEEGQQNCWLVQTLLEEGTNNFLAEIRLGVSDGTGELRYVMLMSSPTGILLTARPAFRIDRSPEGTPMNWHNCTEARCAASKTLTAEDVQSLRRGAQMIIGYQRFLAPEPTVFAVSLLGVTDGLSALTQLQAQ